MSVINIGKNNFDEVKNSGKTVLIDFYADWCGPCRMVSPVIDEIAEENPQYVFGKVNIDREPELARAFGVMSIPTIVIMKNGAVADRQVGAMPKDQILDMLEG